MNQEPLMDDDDDDDDDDDEPEESQELQEVIIDKQPQVTLTSV